LATRIFEIEGGKLEDYPGNYEDYLWQKQRTGTEAADSGAKRRSPEPGASVRPGEQQKRAKKTNPSSIRKMEKDRDELEEKISRCEAEIASLELELGHFKSAEESIRIAGAIETLRARLKETTKLWEELVVKLEGECPSDESQIPSGKAD
jgi:ATP-binding cassette subfamily F protein 3